MTNKKLSKEEFLSELECLKDTIDLDALYEEYLADSEVIENLEMLDKTTGESMTMLFPMSA